MSWDVLVQDLPPDALSVDDIPDDFDPQPIGSRSWILHGIRAVVPFADVSNPAWVSIEGDDFSIEVNLGQAEEVESFTMHARGGDLAAFVIADILGELRLRALDPQAASGIFTSGSDAADGLHRWRAYRDRIVGEEGTS